MVLRSELEALGDFTKQSYQPACLFVRLLRCGKGYIAQLCAPFLALQADENPTHSGNSVSISRLSPHISLVFVLRPCPLHSVTIICLSIRTCRAIRLSLETTIGPLVLMRIQSHTGFHSLIERTRGND